MTQITRNKLVAIVNLCAYKARFSDAQRKKIVAHVSDPTVVLVAGGIWSFEAGCKCPLWGSGLMAIPNSGEFIHHFDKMTGTDIMAQRIEIVG